MITKKEKERYVKVIHGKKVRNFDEVNKEFIKKAVEFVGNKTKTAKILGICRNKLYRILKK
jgi:transcriptional regulator with PAS, ATPase and Fis domain